MKNNNILVVFGTRPEAIKLVPLIKALLHSQKFDLKICVTAQHREMLDSVLEEYGIIPDYDLDIMKPGQSLDYLTSSIVRRVGKILDELNPQAVIVHGDTTTAFCTALAAFYRSIRVVHIEAGLRSKNIFSPHPEEFNRRAISMIADIHFSPTKTACDNLIYEDIDKSKIFIVGNTAIDTLTYNLESYAPQKPSDKKLILVTVHRREHSEDKVSEIFDSLRTLCMRHSEIHMLYPIHKSPKIRDIAKNFFGDIPNFEICEPLPTREFHFLLSKCHMVLTDSGGIQEEAAFLGKPTLILRDVTERVEALGNSLILVGTNRHNILSCAELLLNDQNEYNRFSQPSDIFGNGHASERIVDILQKLL